MKKKEKMDFQFIIILILIGVASGLLGGMVGIGGGIIIVPALIYLLGFNQLQAQGTSLALLMLPVGILGVMQYYKQGHVDFSIVIILAAGFVMGSFLGSKLALQLPADTVKKIFASLLLFMAFKMLFFDKASKKKQDDSTHKITSKEHSIPEKTIRI